MVSESDTQPTGLHKPEAQLYFREAGKVTGVNVRAAAPGTGETDEATTICVVATNADLAPAEMTKVAEIENDGFARTIRPAHTMFDGDTLFALFMGRQSAWTNTADVVAAEVVAEAIIRAVSP